MMKFPHHAIFAVNLFALSGCASTTGFPEPVISSKDDLAQTAQYFVPEVLTTYSGLTAESARRSYRDDIVYGRMHAYDVQYREFLKALSQDAGNTQIGGDLIALTLNGLGATTGDAPTKAALAAASGGIIGAQGAVNKDLFYKNTVPALVAQMEAQRTQVRAAIERGLATSDSEYPLPKALVDLDQYQLAGSLPGALNGISQDAGTKLVTAEKDIQITRDKNFTGALPAAVAIGEQISNLTDAQALSVSKAMEPNLKSRPQNIQDAVNGIDPSGKRLTDGSAARIVLRQWSILDPRDAASQKQWTDAIAAATKN